VHTAAAGAFGMPEGTLSALLADVSSAPVPERIKPLLQYLGKLILTPAKITQRTLRRCWQQGGKKGLHDAVAVCGLFNLVNRLAEGLGIRRARTTSSPRPAGPPKPGTQS